MSITVRVNSEGRKEEINKRKMRASVNLRVETISRSSVSSSAWILQLWCIQGRLQATCSASGAVQSPYDPIRYRCLDFKEHSESVTHSLHSLRCSRDLSSCDLTAEAKVILSGDKVELMHTVDDSTSSRGPYTTTAYTVSVASL